MTQGATFGIPNVTLPNAASITALTGLAALSDASVVRVSTYDDDFALVTQVGGVPALVANVVLASSAAGRVWQRRGIVSQKWLQSTTWFLDGTAGDDQNDGQSNVTALKTGAELARRMARQAVGNGSAVTVTMLSNIADALDFRGVTAIGGINVVAVESTQGGAGATGTLTASTAINRAANTFQQITAAGVDFAPFIATKSKIVLTSGANAGAYAWFESGAGGVGVAAQTSAFARPTTGTPTVVTPAIMAGGVVPTMTTTDVNVAFGSANKTWAQLPFSDYAVGAPGAANNSAWI